MLTVYKDLLAALRILRRGVTPANEFLGTGSRQLKALEITVEQRQSFHHSGIKRSCHVGAVSLQLWRLSRDFDSLLSTSYLELRIYARAGVGRNDNVLQLYRLEAGRFRSHRVNIGDQVRNGIVAVLVCSRLVTRALALVRDCHLGVGHRGALRIGHRADDAAIDRLGKGRGRGQCNYQECQSDYCQNQSPCHRKFLRRSFRPASPGLPVFHGSYCCWCLRWEPSFYGPRLKK